MNIYLQTGNSLLILPFLLVLDTWYFYRLTKIGSSTDIWKSIILEKSAPDLYYKLSLYFAIELHIICTYISLVPVQNVKNEIFDVFFQKISFFTNSPKQPQFFASHTPIQPSASFFSARIQILTIHVFAYLLIVASSRSI